MSKTDIDLGPLPELIGYVLRRAQLVVFQDFFSAFAPFDIRPAQFSVLTVIERNPGLTQSQVAAALGIKRTNFVGMLDALEKRGLAERRQARARQALLCALPDGGGQRADAQAQARAQGAREPHDRRWSARKAATGWSSCCTRSPMAAATRRATARPLKGAKASRSPRLGSAET